MSLRTMLICINLAVLALPLAGIQLMREVSGNVGGHGFRPHRTEVDQPGNPVPLEQNVVVPDVADARLQPRFDLDDLAQPRKDLAGSPPNQRNESSQTDFQAS